MGKIWKYILVILAGILALIFGRGGSNNEKIEDIIDSIGDKSPVDKVKLGNKLARKGKRRTR